MGSLKSRLSWMVKVSNFYYYRNIPREPESPQVLIHLYIHEYLTIC